MHAKNILSQALSKKTGEIFLLVFTIIAAIALKMLLAITIRFIIDYVLPTPPTEESLLGVRVSIFVAVALLWFITEISSKAQALNLGSYVSTTLSNSVYEAGIRAEITDIKKIDHKSISKKITDDSTKIGNFVGIVWVQYWKEIIALLAIFITLISIQSLLCIITFFTLPLYYILVRGLEKYTVKVYQKTDIKNKRRKEIIEDNFSKLRSIKLKNGIKQEEEKIHHLNEDYYKTYRHYGNISELTSKTIIRLFVALVVAINLGLGGLFVIQGYMETSIGELAVFLILIPMIFSSVKHLMNSSIYVSNIEDELNSLDAILMIKSEIKTEPISSLEDVHSLKFQHVYYIGNKEEESLEDVSFEVKRGEKLGIVSIEGSSNNSIFDLITKLNRPRDGTILINNCDINKLNTFYLRDIVTAVPQEKCLFNDTVANNITYPLEFDEYKYNDALNRSGLKDILIDFEKKEETIISKDYMISEELKQRIILANAFYKDSKIFVLNDVTSSLDVRSEESIMKEIYKLKNKIIIIMSNKVYNVINCDKVLILENDQVLEYGRVQELIHDKQSIFYSMIKKVKISKIIKVS